MQINVNLTKTYHSLAANNATRNTQLLNPKPGQTPGLTYWPLTRRPGGKRHGIKQRITKRNFRKTTDYHMRFRK